MRDQFINQVRGKEGWSLVGRVAMGKKHMSEILQRY